MSERRAPGWSERRRDGPARRCVVDRCARRLHVRSVRAALARHRARAEPQRARHRRPSRHAARRGGRADGHQPRRALPFGTLATRSLAERRTDSGVGDLEIRVRQSLRRYVRPVALGVALGAVAPTGPYVARAGAANLAPEASYLTLGRGVPWWIGEALRARRRHQPRQVPRTDRTLHPCYGSR